LRGKLNILFAVITDYEVDDVTVDGFDDMKLLKKLRGSPGKS